MPGSGLLITRYAVQPRAGEPENTRVLSESSKPFFSGKAAEKE